MKKYKDEAEYVVGWSLDGPVVCKHTTKGDFDNVNNIEEE